jgi:hypothetical protein
MRKLIVLLLVLAPAGCQSFSRLKPFEKAIVVGFVGFTASVAGLMVYTAATTPQITREQYESIFGKRLTAGPRP